MEHRTFLNSGNHTFLLSSSEMQTDHFLRNEQTTLFAARDTSSDPFPCCSALILFCENNVNIQVDTLVLFPKRATKNIMNAEFS